MGGNLNRQPVTRGLLRSSRERFFGANEGNAYSPIEEMLDGCVWRADMKSASSRSAKPLAAKRASTSMKSKTDWARLKTMGSAVSLTEEHAEASVQHIVRGVLRRGLQPLPPKSSISLRVDQDVLEWFKAQGPDYQTRINTVLRAFRDASV